MWPFVEDGTQASLDKFRCPGCRWFLRLYLRLLCWAWLFFLRRKHFKVRDFGFSAPRLRCTVCCRRLYWLFRSLFGLGDAYYGACTRRLRVRSARRWFYRRAGLAARTGVIGLSDHRAYNRNIFRGLFVSRFTSEATATLVGVYWYGCGIPPESTWTVECWHRHIYTVTVLDFGVSKLATVVEHCNARNEKPHSPFLFLFVFVS